MCDFIFSLFQGESLIMTFQFHPENIPFFKCRHKLLPLHNKTSRNSQQARLAPEVSSVLNDIVGTVLW